MASPSSSSALSSIYHPLYTTQPSTRNNNVVVKAISGGSWANLDRLQLKQRQPNQRLLYQAPMEDPLQGFSRGRTQWAIRERDKDHKIRFDVPGMTRNDVKVWIEENMLVFNAEKAQEEDPQWPAQSFGRYSCRIALPENIAFENIKAQVRDGVLYITIPKAPITTKTIGIKVE